jgi:2-C-methyl-D-erythritol 4-phosphate cytidylyltransferase
VTASAAAIVVAAGRGDRLGQDVPKAFVELAGEPLVVHAVRGLVGAGLEEVHVVVPEGEEARSVAVLDAAGLSLQQWWTDPAGRFALALIRPAVR